jgi:hypothetical protein
LLLLFNIILRDLHLQTTWFSDEGHSRSPLMGFRQDQSGACYAPGEAQDRDIRDVQVSVFGGPSRSTH